MREDEHLSTQKKGKNLWFTVSGDVDHHTSKNIKQRIDSEVFITCPECIYLDLSRVEFMDSSGLGLILGRYRTATELGIGFALIEPTDAVMRILKISGCDKLINIIKKKTG